MSGHEKQKSFKSEAFPTCCLYKEGQLLVLNSNSKPPKLERKHCKLQSTGLHIFETNYKDPAKLVQKLDVRIVENIDGCIHFKECKKNFCFKVGEDEGRLVHFCAATAKERSEWVESCKQVLKVHHGVLVGEASRWSYCNGSDQDSSIKTASCGNQTPAVSIPKTGIVAKGYGEARSVDSGHGESPPSSGQTTPFSSKAQSVSCEDLLHLPSKIKWPRICFHKCTPVTSCEVTLLKFLNSSILLIATSKTVHLYDIKSDSVIHNIHLSHAITCVDTWAHYLLIGSSIVHVVDTREENWRRIMVVDKDEKESLMNPSQYTAVFNCNGEFATANMRGNHVSFWCQPVEEGGLMTEKCGVCTCGEQDTSICSLNCQQSTLFVTRKARSGDLYIDIMEWTEQKYRSTVTLNNLTCKPDPSTIAISVDAEFVYMKIGENQVAELSPNTHDMHTAVTLPQKETTCICCLAYLHHVKDVHYVTLGLNNGKVEIHETHDQDQSKKSTLIDKEGPVSPVVALDYSLASGILAVAHKNGILCLWGEETSLQNLTPTKIGKERKHYRKLTNCEGLYAYMPGTFSQVSLLSDVTEFDVDSRGVTINFPSYSLSIPERAIEEGRSVQIQTGVMCYGLVGALKDSTIVSPFVWFASEPEIRFLKPATLKLQHCAVDLTSQGFLKGHYESDSKSYKFEKYSATQVDESSATLDIDHFCVYCVAVYTKQDTDNAKLSIIPIESAYVEGVKKVAFCVAYHLDTCLRAVKEQYKNTPYTVCNPVPIQLSGREGIRVNFAVDTNRWTVANKSASKQITLQQLNFWNAFDSSADLVTAHNECIYPPRFTFEISVCNSSGKTSDKVEFVFSGCTNLEGSPVAYDILLSLPTEQSKKE